MLFHFSFYSNKQPAVPACSHAHSVEFGEYHLSKVKFPGKVAEQSRLNLSELVLRSLRLGLNAARTNLLPAILVQLLMGGLVVSYFYLATARPIFGVLTDWNVNGGLLFSFVAIGFARFHLPSHPGEVPRSFPDVLALSMSGSAILRPVSTIGDEDGAAIASPRALGWAARNVFAAESSEKAAGARIVADRFASLARRAMEKHIISTEIKMTESEA